MNRQKSRLFAKPMLFAAAMIWGASFFIMKDVSHQIPTFFLLAIRFTGGAVLLSLLCAKKWKEIIPAAREYLLPGAVMGMFLFAAYTVQTLGLMGTTPSKNAFLTAVYCVLVPFFNWAVMGERPDRWHITAALLCVAGVGLVSLDGDFTVTWGDGLTLVSAVLFAAHIISVARGSQGKDIYLLTAVQFAAAALCAWVCGLLFETPPPLSLFQNRDILLQLAYLTVLATTAAMVFQNAGQVLTDPSSASVILSLESVFGVVFSVAFYGDEVGPKLLAGFALIFLAVLCSETKFRFLKHPETGKRPSP